METYPNEIAALELNRRNGERHGANDKALRRTTDPLLPVDGYVSPRTTLHGVEIPVTLSGRY